MVDLPQDGTFIHQAHIYSHSFYDLDYNRLNNIDMSPRQQLREAQGQEDHELQILNNSGSTAVEHNSRTNGAHSSALDGIKYDFQGWFIPIGYQVLVDAETHPKQYWFLLITAVLSTSLALAAQFGTVILLIVLVLKFLHPLERLWDFLESRIPEGGVNITDIAKTAAGQNASE